MAWKSETLRTEILGVLKSYAEQATELADETELVGDLGLDSLAVMEVVADIEDKFELTIDDEDLQAVTTVGDVVQAIETRLRKDGRLEA
jgi:acyl carrier protein